MTAEEMEVRRHQAMDLIFKEDYSKAQAARKLGVSRAAVSKWVSKYYEDDVDGLKRVQRSVNSPVLVCSLTPLLDRLTSGAKKLGFPDDRWSTQRLQELLTRLTGLSHDRISVKRTMNRIGWYYDREKKCWKADPQKHSEALASLRGRCLPRKSPQVVEWLEILPQSK